MSRARHEHSDAGIQGADFEVPPPNGVGPLPHYRRGGRAKKEEVKAEGHASRRRHDRPGRQAGGVTPQQMAQMQAMRGAMPPTGMAAGTPTVPMQAKGGRLSAAKRRDMPASEFAFPKGGKGNEGRGPGAYPIDTPGRARNAIATAHGAHGAHPLSGEKLHSLERKVHAKYPGIKISGD